MSTLTLRDLDQTDIGTFIKIVDHGLDLFFSYDKVNFVFNQEELDRFSTASMARKGMRFFNKDEKLLLLNVVLSKRPEVYSYILVLDPDEMKQYFTVTLNCFIDGFLGTSSVKELGFEGKYRKVKSNESKKVRKPRRPDKG